MGGILILCFIVILLVCFKIILWESLVKLSSGIFIIILVLLILLLILVIKFPILIFIITVLGLLWQYNRCG